MSEIELPSIFPSDEDLRRDMEERVHSVTVFVATDLVRELDEDLRNVVVNSIVYDKCNLHTSNPAKYFTRYSMITQTLGALIRSDDFIDRIFEGEESTHLKSNVFSNVKVDVQDDVVVLYVELPNSNVLSRVVSRVDGLNDVIVGDKLRLYVNLPINTDSVKYVVENLPDALLLYKTLWKRFGLCHHYQNTLPGFEIS